MMEELILEKTRGESLYCTLKSMQKSLLNSYFQHQWEETEH